MMTPPPPWTWWKTCSRLPTPERPLARRAAFSAGGARHAGSCRASPGWIPVPCAAPGVSSLPAGRMPHPARLAAMVPIFVPPPLRPVSRTPRGPRQFSRTAPRSASPHLPAGCPAFFPSKAVVNREILVYVLTDRVVALGAKALARPLSAVRDAFRATESTDAAARDALRALRELRARIRQRAHRRAGSAPQAAAAAVHAAA